MEHYLHYLDWLESEQESMLALVENWSTINSGSENLTGLSTMLAALKESFSSLQGDMKEIVLPPRRKIDSKGNLVETPLGNALSIIKRPEAPLRILLGGHYDTVFPPSTPFQKTKRLDYNTLQGPGVADLKGGLVIMLKSLEALERSPYAKNIGWEILINPDEEIGSPGSSPLFEKAAQRNHVGLVFEPSFFDGTFVSSRKGSSNFTVVVRGKAAHAGRDFHAGRNAIYALAHFIQEVERLSNSDAGISVNIGHIEGGGPVNIVPDIAIGRFNVRTKTAEEMTDTKKRITEIAEAVGKRDGIRFQVHEDQMRMAKPFNPATQKLFEDIKSCGDIIGIKTEWREGGGVCDGNNLGAAGLPTIDSIGAIGGNIHTFEEYILIDSLYERSRLVTLYLLRLAIGDLTIPTEKSL